MGSMDKIPLDMYTERLLQKRTQELARFVTYDIFVRIEQIVNEAIIQHYIYRHKLEELMCLLQEVDLKKEDKNSDKAKQVSVFKGSCQTKYHRKENNVLYIHISNEIDRYRNFILLMLAGKADTNKRTNTNGITH